LGGLERSRSGAISGYASGYETCKRRMAAST
jgi:hypothetical protein